MRHYGTASTTYVSPEDAARILRVNVHTLYRALRRSEVPAMRVGPYFRIPVTFLLLEPPAALPALPRHEPDQLEFEYDVPIHPVRVWRNTKEPIRPWNYEASLYGLTTSPTRPSDGVGN